MIEKLFSYQHNDISYNYFRDCRTTLLYGKLMTEPHTIMFGTAFCTKEDTYNIAIGCKLALHRFCKNLKLSREARTELQCVLEDHLYHYEKKMIQEYITSYIEEHEKKKQEEVKMTTATYSFSPKPGDSTIKVKIVWDPRDVLAHGDGFVILRSPYYDKDLDYTYTITNPATKKEKKP